MSESQFDTLNFNETFKKTDSLGRAALFLASWFFTGLMPKAPGTVGTLAAIPIALAIHFLGAVKGGVCLLCLISVAVLTSDLSRKLLGRRDPSEIVIDEVAGFSVALFLLSPSWLNLILGFLLFRLFDISKPFPIKRLERVKGGFGIVLDDLFAGIYVNLALRMILLFVAE